MRGMTSDLSRQPRDSGLFRVTAEFVPQQCSVPFESGSFIHPPRLLHVRLNLSVTVTLVSSAICIASDLSVVILQGWEVKRKKYSHGAALSLPRLKNRFSISCSTHLGISERLKSNATTLIFKTSTQCARCLFIYKDEELHYKRTPLKIYFASQSPVFSSQKPSRSSNFCGGALSRGEDGLPYALRRLFPQPKLLLVSTPVIGFVPLAYLQRAFINRHKYFRLLRAVTPLSKQGLPDKHGL